MRRSLGFLSALTAASILVSACGASTSGSPSTTNGSQSSTPSASPCVVATTTLTLSATDTPASDVYTIQAQTSGAVEMQAVQLTISCEHGSSTYVGPRNQGLQGMTLVLSVAEQRTYSTSGHVYRINGTVGWSATDVTTIKAYDLTVSGGSLGSSAQRCTKASGCSTATSSGGASAAAS